jgi:hypothetical protein
VSTAPQPLVPNTVEAAMQDMTLRILGIDPAADTAAYSKVRIGWQTEGQPAWSVDQDVVILRSVEDEDDINQLRDFKTRFLDGVQVSTTTTYIRVWKIFWVIYGPNAFDNGRKIRSGLLQDKYHDLMTAVNLYLVTALATPRRVPELFAAQWFNRVDFEARFNELTTESDTVGTIASAEVILETADGVVADIQIPQGE